MTSSFSWCQTSSKSFRKNLLYPPIKSTEESSHSLSPLKCYSKIWNHFFISTSSQCRFETYVRLNCLNHIFFDGIKEIYIYFSPDMFPLVLHWIHFQVPTNYTLKSMTTHINRIPITKITQITTCTIEFAVFVQNTYLCMYLTRITSTVKCTNVNYTKFM